MNKIVNNAMTLLNDEVNTRKLMSPKSLAWIIMKTEVAAGASGDTAMTKTGIANLCEQSMVKSQGERS